LNRAWIEARIPHQGRMCLLDEVLDWNVGQIRCRTATHRAPDNPLRAHDRLSVLCGIEYAAQTMALHGALAGGAMHAGAVGVPQMGLLAGIRAVRCSVLRLDDVESDLICEVTHVAGDGLTALYEFALYEFALRDQGRMLLGGRASVVLDAGRHLRK
jgi:predicted hotdog family 3-hydroxylacyl-ACP dehydratase